MRMRPTRFCPLAGSRACSEAKSSLSVRYSSMLSSGIAMQTPRSEQAVDAKRLHQLLVICAIGWTAFGINYGLMGRARGVAIDVCIVTVTLLIRRWMLQSVAARAVLAA